jgi:hypothetical protein
MTIRNSYLLRLIAVSIGIVLICGSARAAGSVTRVNITKGEAITGANRLLGEPLYSYDFAPNSTFGFNTVDELDPVGPLPVPLTPASDQNAVLATTFANLAAVPPDVLPNLNVPLRDVGTFVTGLLDRSAVPFHLDPTAPIVGPTQSEPDQPDPITLRDWLKGQGVAFTRCGPRGNFVNIFVKRLIPNRMYSAIALWLRDDGSFRPVSLGGVPNVIMTNEHGNGHISRRLNFCPDDAAREGVGADHLIGIAVIYHSAHVAWGAIPTPAAPDFLLPPGSMVHAHIWFDFGAGQRIAY